MSERMRKRNAYDGPLGCEKPRRAVLFPGDPCHATPFASPSQPISSRTVTTSGPSKSSWAVGISARGRGLCNPQGAMTLALNSLQP